MVLEDLCNQVVGSTRFSIIPVTILACLAMHVCTRGPSHASCGIDSLSLAADFSAVLVRCDSLDLPR